MNGDGQFDAYCAHHAPIIEHRPGRLGALAHAPPNPAPGRGDGLDGSRDAHRSLGPDA